MINERFSRLVRKEYLIFQQEKTRAHKALKTNLGAILKPSDYSFVEAEFAQALYMKIMEVGVGNCFHYNFSKVKIFELNFEDKEKLFNVDISNSLEWVFVCPIKWQIHGCFLISQKALFRRISKISYFLDDDFDIYDGSLGNVIFYRGERSRSEISRIELIIKGEYFSFITGCLFGHQLSSEDAE